MTSLPATTMPYDTRSHASGSACRLVVLPLRFGCKTTPGRQPVDPRLAVNADSRTNGRLDCALLRTATAYAHGSPDYGSDYLRFIGNATAPARGVTTYTAPTHARNRCGLRPWTTRRHDAVLTTHGGSGPRSVSTKRHVIPLDTSSFGWHAPYAVTGSFALRITARP